MMLPKERFVLLDDIKYDLENEQQLEAYEIAQEYLEKMVLTEHEGSGYREYRAYDLDGTPEFPTREYFGYEDLKDGSVMLDVKTSTVFMFSSIPNEGVGEWNML